MPLCPSDGQILRLYQIVLLRTEWWFTLCSTKCRNSSHFTVSVQTYIHLSTNPLPAVEMVWGLTYFPCLTFPESVFCFFFSSFPISFSNETPFSFSPILCNNIKSDSMSILPCQGQEDMPVGCNASWRQFYEAHTVLCSYSLCTYEGVIRKKKKNSSQQRKWWRIISESWVYSHTESFFFLLVTTAGNQLR